ncbi:hypothetical protein [Kribbella swartbergensis]
MEDVREVGAELRRLAEAEPLDPFDPAELLARGRRGRRRRKVLTAGGAIAGMAVVALAASLLPDLGSAGDQPQVADHQAEQSLFEPVPGVPRGEAGADQPVTKAEAARRCALRNPGEKRPLRLGSNTESGRTVLYDIKIGETAEVRWCKVPGGDKPSAALVAAAAQDPLPTSVAGQLRNCSVQLWVDLTGWKVMASDQSRSLGSVLVAVSPSGRKAVACYLSSTRPAGPAGPGANSMFVTLDSLDQSDPIFTPATASRRADLFAGGGGGSTFAGWGRVASNASRIVLQLGPGPGHEVPVDDGWFAVSWQKPGNANKVSPLKITAYDKAGKVIKVISH